MNYSATVVCYFTVNFKDDGENDLFDQASDALFDFWGTAIEPDHFDVKDIEGVIR